MLTGGCYCGAIRYEAHGAPFHETICHCDDCRRVAGAPVVAWFSIATSGYRVVAGQPKVFASSAHAERSFCADCGTGLTFQSRESPDEIDVTICSLDDPGLAPPRDHTRAGSKVRWWKEIGQLPEFVASRPADS